MVLVKLTSKFLSSLCLSLTNIWLFSVTLSTFNPFFYIIWAYLLDRKRAVEGRVKEETGKTSQGKLADFFFFLIFFKYFFLVFIFLNLFKKLIITPGPTSKLFNVGEWNILRVLPWNLTNKFQRVWFINLLQFSWLQRWMR